MSKRVILGNRNGEVGMWVSKPGKSADSAAYEDLLFDASRTIPKPMISGIISNPSLDIVTRNTNSTAQDKDFPKGNGTGGVIYSYAVISESGYAYWQKDYFYNAAHTSLGYIPLCHIWAGSPTAGNPYPKIEIFNDRIRLSHKEIWGHAYSRVTGKFPVFRCSAYNQNWPYNCLGYVFDYYETAYSYPEVSASNKPDTFTFNVDIHYTIYSTPLGVT